MSRVLNHGHEADPMSPCSECNRLDEVARGQAALLGFPVDETPRPLRSSLNLHIEITHSRNLHTDAQGLATEVEAFLTNRLAQYDNLGSATASLQGAVLHRRGS